MVLFTDTQHPYLSLTPDVVLSAIESMGYECDGKLLALNSYENRVYQVGVEGGTFLVAKFYRPNRWSDEAILEEHQYSIELQDHELPVVAPLAIAGGQTLHEYEGFRFAIFPRQGGRWPEFDDLENLRQMGRLLARIHAVGSTSQFQYRQRLSVEVMGRKSIEYIRSNGFIPPELENAYQTLTDDLVCHIEQVFERVGSIPYLRIHGDCHPGNVLWTDNGPHFVDLDDCCMGPAIQDLWMLLDGDHEHKEQQVTVLLEGYSQFNDFDPVQLQLIEPLRTLRMIHYSAWLARRWDDPAFQQNFPWFNSQRYWEEQILMLREQAFLLTEPALVWR